jgi:beta-lactamase class A
MALFKREEQVEEDFEMEERGFVRPKKNLSLKEEPEWKRTRPGSRRGKKNEFNKPWGKKERYIVLGVLLFTVITATILALSSRSWKLPGIPRIKIPEINIFKGETIIITKEGVTKDPNKEKGERIVKEFRTATKDLTGIYALYVTDLGTGYSFGVNENETMDAASLIKLPVMALTYKEAEAGVIKLDDEPKGSDKTYRELLRAMGKRSDNTAQLAVVEILGRSQVQKTATDLGMANTNYEENITTPRDVGEYFEKLWNGKIISSTNKEEMLSFLTDTIYEDYLKKGVPEDTRVAHKFGVLLHVINDAGIVYTEKPYVVVIMTKGIVEKETIEAFPKLSKIVYDVMTEK